MGRPVAGGAVGPSVDVIPPDGETAAVVIIAAGGKENSFDPAASSQLTALRMRPFAAHVHRRGHRHGVAVWTVRYRYRGWNGEQRSPVADVQWALAEVRRRHGDVPVAMIGHSMGGRTVLATGGDPSVRGVCALAPWTERDDPVEQLADRSVLIVHGGLDRVTSPRRSRRFAERAAQAGAHVSYLRLPGEMHAMVVRWVTWHRLASGFALASLGLAPMPRRIEAARLRRSGS